MIKATSASIAILIVLAAVPAVAQTTSTARDTAKAYGARLTTPEDPAKPLNTRRVNDRINNRINNRISLRIERYTVNSTAQPLAAEQRATTDTTAAFKNAADAIRAPTASTATTERQVDPYADDRADDGTSSTSRPIDPR